LWFAVLAEALNATSNGWVTSFDLEAY
jgi:hypothetical protein